MKILVYGYGNPGREDDALGPVLAERVEKWIQKEGIDHISVDSNYQLNIEDALVIRDYDAVIFADATVEEIEDIKFTEVSPSEKAAFTMHSVSAGYLMHLSREINRITPDAYMLHIRGYRFDLREGLTEAGNKNLDKAFSFIRHVLQHPEELQAMSLEKEG